MPVPAFRALMLAAGLSLALGGVARAQEATAPAADQTTAPAADQAATTDTAAPADAASTPGAPVEPSDAADPATPAAPDASGNSGDDPSPTAEPSGGADAAPTPAIPADLPILGQPVPGGMDWQVDATSLHRDAHFLDTMINWIILVIVLFVTALLAIVVVRFNERRNPTPARFTHNSPLEITWTIVPIVILVFIGAFSLPVLFEQQEIPEGDVHITVTGRQWFWDYEYPDEGIAFSSYMIGYAGGVNLSPEISAQLQEAGYTDQQFKLATDNPVVVPVGATVVVTVTGGDVIHSWKVPAFGVMQDAVPGRLAHLWFNAETEGTYFGQCSELCGKDHAYMPITVKVVSPEAYQAWVAQAQADFPAG